MVASSLDGSMPAIALSKLNEFRLGGQYSVPHLPDFDQTLFSLFHRGSPMADAALLTFETADVLEGVPLQAPSIEYPQSRFGQSLHLLAQLIKSEVGLDIGTVDINGWDTHIAQGAIDGQMPRLLANLSESLAAFYSDLGENMEHVTIVTMSEFGRRAAENSSRGTDHGHGNAMFVIGRNINGERYTDNGLGSLAKTWPAPETWRLQQISARCWPRSCRSV
jgi:uncharacterized protein (DUF1501 family)